MGDGWRIFKMAVWRNFVIMLRYKLNFLFDFLGTGLWGFTFLLMALALDHSMLQEVLGSSNYAAFMLLGMTFQMFNNVATFGGGEMLRDELSSGQIDYTFSSPFSRYGYILANIAASAVRSSMFFMPPFLIGLWLTAETLTPLGVVLGVLAVICAVACLSQMGTVFAALVLRYQQVSAVYGLFGFGILFLSGMYVPLQLLPLPLRLIGFVLLPQSVGMDLMRHYIMHTHTLLPVGYDWLFMGLQFLVLGWAARKVVASLERAARDQGLHYL